MIIKITYEASNLLGDDEGFAHTVELVNGTFIRTRSDEDFPYILGNGYVATKRHIHNHHTIVVDVGIFKGVAKFPADVNPVFINTIRSAIKKANMLSYIKKL